MPTSLPPVFTRPLHGFVLLVAAAMLVTITGCTATRPVVIDDEEGIHDDPAVAQLRAELASGYALLHDLFKSNGQVGRVLLIKTITPPTAQIIREVAESCNDAAKRIEQFAAGQSWMNLTEPGLPLMEAESRKAIESQTTREILFGKNVEIRLLLAQTRAMSYAVGLARSLEAKEPDETRKAWLAETADKMDAFNTRMFERLRLVP